MFGGRSIGIYAISLWTAAFLIIGCGKEETVGPDGNGTTIDTIPPAAVTDLTVRSIGTNSISLMWSAPGDDGTAGRATAYDLRCHTEPITNLSWGEANRIGDVQEPKVAGQFEIFTVTQLACSTTYYFALKTSDEVPNTSELSNCPSGITRQERTAPMAVQDLAAEAISDTSFLLTWTAPGDDGLAGTASQYDIRFSRYFITPADWDAASQAEGEPDPKTGGEPDSFVVSGVDPDVNYYFVLKTADEVPNLSEMSNCCSAMAYSESLMVSPFSFIIGDVEELTIVFRAQAGARIKILIWGHQPYYRWNIFSEVVDGFYTEGVHTVQWDFWSEIFNMYIDEDRYEVELLYDGVTVASKYFRAFWP